MVGLSELLTLKSAGTLVPVRFLILETMTENNIEFMHYLSQNI